MPLRKNEEGLLHGFRKQAARGPEQELSATFFDGALALPSVEQPAGRERGDVRGVR
jgi:hypothetical protein